MATAKKDRNEGSGDALQKEGHYLKALVAGGISGAISRTATAPLDRLKVLMQAGVKETRNGHAIKGVFTATKAIYLQDGWRGFFNGNGANVLKIVPESAVKFYFFERINDVVPVFLLHAKHTAQSIFSGKSRAGETGKALLPYDPVVITENRIASKFIAGATAGIIAQVAIYPLEVCKTRLSLGICNYRGIADCLSRILRTEGVRGLYKGLSPSLVGIIPYSGIDMGVYFSLREWWGKRSPPTQHPEGPGMMVTLAMGATSSFIGQTVSYPLQVVRTRLQVQGVQTAVGETHLPHKYNGIVDCMRKIVHDEGLRALCRGITPNFLKAIPAVSINYLFYEQIKLLLNC